MFNGNCFKYIIFVMAAGVLRVDVKLLNILHTYTNDKDNNAQIKIEIKLLQG